MMTLPFFGAGCCAFSASNVNTAALVQATRPVMHMVAAKAGDAAAGQSKSAVCVACHGTDGIGIADIYPNLAGQKAAYLESAIKALRDGVRSGSNAAMMQPMVANLSDEDAADLAAYYASLGNCK